MSLIPYQGGIVTRPHLTWYIIHYAWFDLVRSYTFLPLLLMYRHFETTTTVHPDELLDGSVPLMTLSEQAEFRKQQQRRNDSYHDQHQHRHFRTQQQQQNSGDDARTTLMMEYLFSLEDEIKELKARRRTQPHSGRHRHRHRPRAYTDEDEDEPQMLLQDEHYDYGDDEDDGEFYPDPHTAESPTLQAYRHTAAILSDRFRRQRQQQQQPSHTYSPQHIDSSLRRTQPRDGHGGFIAGAEKRWKTSLRSPTRASTTTPLPTRHLASQRRPYPQHDADAGMCCILWVVLLRLLQF